MQKLKLRSSDDFPSSIFLNETKLNRKIKEIKYSFDSRQNVTEFFIDFPECWQRIEH